MSGRPVCRKGLDREEEEESPQRKRRQRKGRQRRDKERFVVAKRSSSLCVLCAFSAVNPSSAWLLLTSPALPPPSRCPSPLRSRSGSPAAARPSPPTWPPLASFAASP